MKKVVLVDDKTTNMLLLKNLISEHCPSLLIAATASKLDEAYESISRHRPDIVFLDVEMPDGSGFDLLRRFSPPFFEVIFTTAYSRYAVEAFREHALGYLLKPIRIDELQQAVQRAEQQIELRQSGSRLLQYLERQEQAGVLSKIRLPSLEGYIFVNPQDIFRCEASGSYTTFYLAGGEKILISMRLKACEEMLPATFFRVHHSHIVNLSYIRKYVKGRGGQVLLLDGSEVDVAANRKEAFLKAIGKPV